MTQTQFEKASSDNGKLGLVVAGIVVATLENLNLRRGLSLGHVAVNSRKKISL